MADGLSSGDMAGEISRHKKHADEHAHEGEGSDADDEKRSHDRTLSVIEAVMLAVVALLAAYTGYASAKWNTESSVKLAQASAARTEANRAELDAQNLRNFDSTTFNTWFSAYLAGNTTAESVAVRRFRPAFKVAFDAWLATDPFTNAKAPPGPTYMPQYKQPELATANALDAKANGDYALGVQAGSNADNYIRDTIYLATILFLIGISGHFRFLRIRVSLVVLSGLMMLVAIVEIATSPPIRSQDLTMIRLIAAIDSQRGIAIDSGIPWKLPGDTAYFRAKTASGLVLMGRATYEEFAAPLHDRENYVLTSATAPFRAGFRAVTSLQQLRAAHPDEDVWVIGGAGVYQETIVDAEELLLTQVLQDFHCTKFFPPYQAAFELEHQSADHQEGGISYRFEAWRPRTTE